MLAAGFGVFGLILKRLNVPIVPLILGMVLGSIMEVKLRAAMGRVDGLADFVSRPISALLVIAIIWLVINAIRTGVRDMRLRAALAAE
jgi:putative tricarboxylic transport membrane protein